MHARTCPNPELTETLQAHLVLQPVPPPPHVHVPGVGVIEAALAQPAVEPDHFALAVAHLRHKAQLSMAPGEGRLPPPSEGTEPSWVAQSSDSKAFNASVLASCLLSYFKGQLSEEPTHPPMLSSPLPPSGALSPPSDSATSGSHPALWHFCLCPSCALLCLLGLLWTSSPSL